MFEEKWNRISLIQYYSIARQTTFLYSKLPEKYTLLINFRNAQETTHNNHHHFTATTQLAPPVKKWKIL